MASNRPLGEALRELSEILQRSSPYGSIGFDGEPCLVYENAPIPLKLINEIRAAAGLPLLDELGQEVP